MCHTLGRLNNRNSQFCRLEYQDPGAKDQILLRSLSEVCSLLMSSYDLFTVYILPGCISSHKDTSPIVLEPHSMTSFNLSYLLKGFISKIVTLGVRASTYVLGVC